MLNPTFPKSASTSIQSLYVAPASIAQRTLSGNKSFNTGEEYRIQPVYGDEIWLKLERAGLTPSAMTQRAVLEVCAGTGFLTHHLLSKCSPKTLTVNEISASEMKSARELIAKHHPKASVEWALGDMHKLDFKKTFDVILGNSFLHHFHNVPEVLSRFASLLSDGGVFISLHEPTPMSTVVEGAKMAAYPLAVLAPGLVNDIARARYKGEPSATDIWMFETAKLKQLALRSGFSRVEICPWHLMRTIAVQQKNLHLSHQKTQLTESEVRELSSAVQIDSRLNRFLPARFFGSICTVFRK